MIVSNSKFKRRNKEKQKQGAMDSEEYELQRANIEDQLENLQLAVKFLHHGCFFHHNNNESEILKTKLNELLKANERLRETNDAYKQLCLQLEAAKKMRDEVVDLFESVKMDYDALSDIEEEDSPENNSD